jgi:hypothetical protein
LAASALPWLGKQNQNPATYLLPEHPVQGLLMRANDLSSGARRVVKPAALE